MNKYNIILADPPWSYKDKSKNRSGAADQYNTMDIEDIKSMKIDTISADDCLLFMWATAPLLREGLDVVEAWGFTFKTVAFTWIKRYKMGNLLWGLGRWTRSNPEFVFLGTKGKPKRVSAGVLSVIEEGEVMNAETMGHSRKPDFVHKRIVELCGDIPRIELFARREMEGWDVWGNETKMDFDLMGNKNE